MAGQNESTARNGGIDIPPRLAHTDATTMRAELPHPIAGDTLLQRKYSELTRKHLGHLFYGLFTDFTGLRFHIAWAPLLPCGSGAAGLPTGCSVSCWLAATTLAAQPTCRSCGPRQLARTLNADGDGLAFKCRLGVRNYWLPMRVRGVLVGIAYLRSLDGSHPSPPARPGSARNGTRVLSRTEFQRAAQLLRLIIQHVQTLDLADLRKDELTNAGRAVLALEKEQARLREALRRHLPAPPPLSRCPRPESHPAHIVHHLLECIERDYAQPLTLQRCAGRLGNNPTYLSALFSRALGIPFKSYLTAFRIEKAEQLLSDPAKTVSEVAFAVGYASENRFRRAFRKATGLAPRAWREILRVRTMALALWILDEMELLEMLIERIEL